MKRKMSLDNLKSAAIPLTAYLLTGFIIIRLTKLSVDSFYFVVWACIAAVMLGIRGCLGSPAVTAGITVYAAAAVIWFWSADHGTSRIQGLLAVLGLLGNAFFRRLFMHRAAEAVLGYGILALLIGLEFAGIRFMPGIIALSIFLFLNSVSETISLFHGEKANSLILIYAATALLTLVAPAPEKPYDWGFVVKTVRALSELAENIALELQYYWGNKLSDGIFHFGYAGYSDSAVTLSMGLKDKDVEQLSLYGTRTRRNLYLKGNVCDSYTGEYWETNVTEETVNYYVDSLMTLYAIFYHTQDKNQLKKFMEVQEFEITMEYIKTQSLFYPLKLLDITEPDIQRAGDNIRAGEINTRGHKYSFRFVDLDYAGDSLIEIIKDSGNITYNEETYDLIFEKMEEYYNIDLEKMSYQEFLSSVSSGQEAVWEQYTDPGAAVSPKVAALAEEITADCISDYEKCRALEAYLRRYEYNKNINAPENENLLDWFLFERQEGYCVHYATALAVMLRCQGIPSRLAEGFLVDYKGYTGFCSYSVSSQKAHTWVEAYIDGFGWIRLEPTAVNGGNAELPWYLESASREEPEPEAESWAAGEEEEPEAQENAGEKTKGEELWLPVLLLLGGTAAAAAVTLLVLLVHKRIRLKRSSDPEVLLQHVLVLLKKSCSPKEGSETLREYFVRLTKNEAILDGTRDRLFMILELAEEYWYGGKDLDEEAVKRIKELRDGLM